MTDIEHPHQGENCEICSLIENVIRPIIEFQTRQKVAKEIEAMKHTIVTVEGGISSHTLSECRSMRQQDYDAAQARYAAIARGKQ